jgi:hypothetical protein
MRLRTLCVARGRRKGRREVASAAGISCFDANSLSVRDPSGVSVGVEAIDESAGSDFVQNTGFIATISNVQRDDIFATSANNSGRAPFPASLLSVLAEGRRPALEMSPVEIRERRIAALITLFEGPRRDAPERALLVEYAHWIALTAPDAFGRPRPVGDDVPSGIRGALVGPRPSDSSPIHERCMRGARPWPQSSTTGSQ